MILTREPWIEVKAIHFHSYTKLAFIAYTNSILNLIALVMIDKHVSHVWLVILEKIHLYVTYSLWKHLSFFYISFTNCSCMKIRLIWFFSFFTDKYDLHFCHENLTTGITFESHVSDKGYGLRLHAVYVIILFNQS